MAGKEMGKWDVTSGKWTPDEEATKGLTLTEDMRCARAPASVGRLLSPPRLVPGPAARASPRDWPAPLPRQRCQLPFRLCYICKSSHMYVNIYIFFFPDHRPPPLFSLPDSTRSPPRWRSPPRPRARIWCSSSRSRSRTTSTPTAAVRKTKKYDLNDLTTPTPKTSPFLTQSHPPLPSPRSRATSAPIAALRRQKNTLFPFLTKICAKRILEVKQQHNTQLRF